MISKIAVHQTQLGDIWSQWNVSSGTVTLHRVGLESLGEESRGGPLPRKAQSIIDDFGRRLVAYCQTGDDDFRDIPIDASGWTAFSKRIYACCREIDPGETLTYQALAARAGRPKASRAVGAAMSRNRVLLVIPCHRVIAANGQLRGFSAPGGLRTKRWLLDLEQSGREFALTPTSS